MTDLLVAAAATGSRGAGGARGAAGRGRAGRRPAPSVHGHALLVIGLLVGGVTGAVLAHGAADDLDELQRGVPVGRVGPIRLPIGLLVGGLLAAGALVLALAVSSTPLLIPDVVAALAVQCLLQSRALSAAERRAQLVVLVRREDLRPREGRTLAAPRTTR